MTEFIGNSVCFRAESRRKLTFGATNKTIGRNTVTRSFQPLCMTNDSPLGCCPDCGESIPTGWRLIDYERDDGTEGVWAECPACENVVSPE